ncbi:MAG: homoserine O-acetyltransferase [Thermomicrobiales bacterium]
MGDIPVLPRYSTTTITTPDAPFSTECGASIETVDLAYETWGEPNQDGSNVILILHALTGSAHVARHPDIDGDPDGWWEGIVGPGLAIDTDRYFVICANSLGSCYGSTGPRSIAPDGRRYDLGFPQLTVRDLVNAQLLLLEKLGINRLAAVIGGSLGGMQAVEFAIMAPEMVERAFVIAASNVFHSQGIAYNEIQRRAIMLDPAWRGGSYEPGAEPGQGVALARMVGMVTFQSEPLMTRRFGRREARYNNWSEFQGRYDVEGYLHYQGDKLAGRFDANTYLYLSRVMDSHDVGDGRGGESRAVAAITASCTYVGIESDILFPARHVRASAEAVRSSGGKAVYRELESINGHDGFLNRIEEMSEIIRSGLGGQSDESTGCRFATASNSARTATATTSVPLKGVSNSSAFKSVSATSASAVR